MFGIELVHNGDWNAKIKVTWMDRFLSATFLRLFPSFVTPNQITGFRYLSIPFILYLFLVGNFTLGTIIFIFSVFSDALDGALARTTKQISEWGIVNDPIADKLLIGSVTLIVISTHISVTLAFLIIFFEMALIMFHYKRHQGKATPARWSGKIKMFFQSIGLIFLLLSIISGFYPFLLVAEICLYLSLVFAFMALFVYHSI